MKEKNLTEQLIDINTDMHSYDIDITNGLYTIKQIFQDIDRWTLGNKLDYINDLYDELAPKIKEWKKLYHEKIRVESMFPVSEREPIDCRSNKRYNIEE